MYKTEARRFVDSIRVLRVHVCKSSKTAVSGIRKSIRYCKPFFAEKWIIIWWIHRKYLHLRPENIILSQKELIEAKNEENDNGFKQLPSGSLAKLKNLVFETAMVICALSTKVFFDILLQLF